MRSTAANRFYIRAVQDEYGAMPAIPLKRIYKETKVPRTPLMLRLHEHFVADPESFYNCYRVRPVVESGISALRRKFQGCVRSRNP